MTFRTATALLAAITCTLAGAIFAQTHPIDPASTQPLARQLADAATRPTTGEATDALAAEAREKIAVIEWEIARLRAAGGAAGARADVLEQELRDVRARHGSATAVSDDRPELHVVGVHSGKVAGEPGPRGQRPWGPGRAVVEVQDTGRPIVLAVCAYNRVKWQVRVATGARIQKVLLGGYEPQDLSGLPDGVPIEAHVYEGRPRSANYFFTSGPESDNHAEAVARIRALTKLEINTFQGAQTYPGQPFVVGPGNPEWVAQRMLSDLVPSYREAVAPDLARRRAALGDVRFRAVRFTARPPPHPAMPPEVVPHLADFSPRGPIEGTERALPARAQSVAFDSADGTVYVVEQHRVMRLDPNANQPIEMVIEGVDLPRMSWPRAATFDTKRRRLLVAAQQYLYTYEPAGQKWSILIDLEGINLAGLAYCEPDDCLYGLVGSYGQPTAARMIRYAAADGAAEQFISPIPPVALPRTDPSQVGQQLIAVGEKLAVLLEAPQPRRGRPQREPQPDTPQPRPRCFLIDPRTGHVTYSGPTESHRVDVVRLTNDELGASWRALASLDGAEIQRALPRLATAGDQAVEFIRANVAPPPATDPGQVRAWIAKLDREDFAARDEATAALRRLGPAAEPHLREALTKNPSPESATRINALLADIQTSAAAHRKLDRDSLAADLLARIGTPAAIDLLSEWAAGAEDAPMTLAARRALQDFARE